MKKIFIYIDSVNGCTLHRLLLPYSEVKKQTDEFTITFGFGNKDLSLQEKLDIIKDNDIFIFHRLLPNGLLDNIKKQCPNTKLIIDLDDYWRLNDMHPSYQLYKEEQVADKIIYHIKNVDYVTCTTEYLANKIKPFNPNVIILPNALNPEGQFEPHPSTSNKLRFGLTGGSSHNKDVQLLEGVVKQLSPDILNQIQFVLCGFDKGVYKVTDEKGNVELRDVPWHLNQWTDIEKMLTDNYRTVSPEHKEFLNQFNWKMEFNSDEPYKRLWTRDVLSYGTIYNEFDVLLVPLIGNDFTACKSELKLIEASVMNKPVIVSEVLPYTICGINAIEKGGTINPNGNCIMINNNKGSKAWVKAITKLVKDVELRNMIASNLSNLTKQGVYCLKDLTKERIKFLQSI